VWAAWCAAAVFGVGLGGGTVVFPLLAVDAGYSASEIGYLAGISAALQLLTRLGLGAAMSRFPDRVLVTAAATLLAVSFAAVVVSTSFIAFALAMALQGASRAAFWTGIQTHVVRGDGDVSKSLARIVLVGDAGLMAGPLLAGFLIQGSPRLALALGGAVGALAALVSLVMRRFPPFRAENAPQGGAAVWRRPPVLAGSIGTGVAGSWRSMLSSYIPVALVEGGQSASTIGVAVGLASAAGTVSALTLSRVRLTRPLLALAVGCLAAGAGVAAVGFVATWIPAVIACLVISGYGAGVLQITGTAVAAEAVHPEERGHAIATTGTARAGAMLVTPLGVAVLLHSATVAVSLAAVGGLLAAPSVVVRRLRRSAG
jgi:MFS family permease